MMQPIRASALALLMFAANVLGQGPTREQIRAAVESGTAAVQSLRVNFRRAAHGPSGHYVHGELSFLGSDQMLLDSGHGWSTRSWKAFYARSRSYLRGRRIQVEWPNKLAFEEKQLAEGEQIERFAVQSWFRASGYWPRRCGIPEPRFFGTSTGLITALRDRDYVVRPGRDAAHGAQCVVLEKAGVDRIWLDPDKGFALRRRHWLQGGVLAMEVEVPQLRSVGPLFLPANYTVRVLRSATGTEMSTATRIDATVLDYRLNDLGPDELRYTAPPGMFRFDRVHPENAKQIVPGGLRLLLDEAERQRHVHAAEHRTRGLSFGLLAALIAALWAASWLLPTWLQRRRAPVAELLQPA
ncbi:MAG: hypothetical protein H6837_14920 [Planctomycetes bacterium]|nr:hypothetical protein [Planctomycetota bacterium]